MLNEIIKFLNSNLFINKDDFRHAKLIAYIEEYLKQKKTYSSFFTGNENKLDMYFIRSLLLLFSTFNFDKIKFTLTDSKSIFYRMINDDFEINLEVFYTKDYDDDEIEAVYSVYYDSQLILQDSSLLEIAIQNIKFLINRYNKQLSSSASGTQYYKSSFFPQITNTLSQTSSF